MAETIALLAAERAAARLAAEAAVETLAGTEAGAAVASYLPSWLTETGKVLLYGSAIEGIHQVYNHAGEWYESSKRSFSKRAAGGGDQPSDQPSKVWKPTNADEPTLQQWLDGKPEGTSLING